ncbi:hypothetical protein ACWES4_06770 [Streptomyces sp. NPDC004011]
MKELNPYTLSHIVMTILGAYSLLVGWLLTRKEEPVGTRTRCVLAASWLAWVGLFFYIRVAGGTI